MVNWNAVIVDEVHKIKVGNQSINPYYHIDDSFL